MKQEPGKQMVSKEEYVRQIGNKASISFYGGILLILAFIFRCAMGILETLVSQGSKTRERHPLVALFA